MDQIDRAIREKVLNKIGAFIKEQAIIRCPVDNGQLRASIQFRIEGDDTVVIFSELDYAPYVEYGTGKFHIDEEGNADPHAEWDIFPVNAKALKFEVGRKERLAAKVGPAGANIVFAKKVHQEGIEPHPFMRPAIFENLENIKTIIVRELS